jgi:Family of unknown function (DUF5677)
MKILHLMLEQTLEQLAIDHPDLGEERLAKAIGTAIEDQVPGAAKILLRGLKARAPEMLREERELDTGFRARNYQRWREGLDLLCMLIVIAEESGSDFNTEFRPQAARESNFVFEAVCSLHARAVLIAREVLCLLEGGFADGALARWRSLHELAVVSGFLSERDNQLAEKYLLAREAQKYKAIMESQDRIPRTGLEPFGEKEIQQAKTLRDRLVQKYGTAIQRDYGWAAKALGKKDPTFRSLEEAVGLDHLRPYFRWASDHVHSGYKPHATFLGTSESPNPILLAGQSNSGLTEPAVQIALSLTQATAALLLVEPNFDHLVISQILIDLVGELQETFIRIERETLLRARRDAITDQYKKSI